VATKAELKMADSIVGELSQRIVEFEKRVDTTTGFMQKVAKSSLKKTCLAKRCVEYWIEAHTE
jgi:hypothetical protein